MDPSTSSVFLEQLATGAISPERLPGIQRDLLADDTWRPIQAAANGARPFTYPVLADDFDGDGDEELLAAVQPQVWDPTVDTDPSRLVVKDGLDVRELWAAGGWSGVVGAVDLTGDEAAEVVVFDVIGTGVPTIFVADGYAIVQRLRVFDGSTGSVLWSQQWPLTIVGAGERALGASGGVSAITGLVTSLSWLADVDGSGVPGLFVGFLDHAATGGSATSLDGARRSTVVVDERFTGRLYRGGDGAVTRVSAADGQAFVGCHGYECSIQGGFPWMAPMPGSSSGGPELAAVTADLLGADVEVRAPDGFVRWRRNLGSGFHVPYPGDYDGHGSADVLVESYDVRAGVLHLTMWSTDRAWRSWTTEPSHGVYWWTPLGDADGDGGADLLLGPGFEVEAVTGAAGRTLWTADVVFDTPEPRTGGLFQLCACPDRDGDGVREVLRVAYVGSPDGSSSSWVSVLDGSTGSERWLSPQLPERAQLAFPTTDADGDGTLDLVAAGASLDDPVVDSLMLTFGSDRPLWPASVAIDERAWAGHDWAAYPVAVDLDGDAASEIALGVGEAVREAETGPWDISIEMWVFNPEGALWSSR